MSRFIFTYLVQRKHQEGYNVIHEIDQEKETKRQKREKKLKKQEAKEIKIKKNKRLFKVQQMDLFKENL